MKAIIHANIIMPDHIVPDGVIVIDGERIVDVGRNIDTAGLECDDAGGLYVGPGLIEMHTHAAKGILLEKDPVGGAEILLNHGVTDALAALYFDVGAEVLISQMRTIRNAMQTGKAPNLCGIYMEAPYMNPKFGSCKGGNPWDKPIRSEDYLPLLEAGKNLVRIWCLAPERDGILDLVKDALAYDSSVGFAVAHSEASPFEIEKLIPYGLRIATHHMDATGTIKRYPAEVRCACVDEAALYNGDIYTEVICDKLGVHVDPYNIRLIRKIKGNDRVIVISDSYVDQGNAPPEYAGADDLVFDAEGILAGTKITLDEACRNMLFNGGASLPDCFRYASMNPARVLGLRDRGSIACGNLANLVITDDQFHIRQVYLRGKTVKKMTAT